MQIELLLDTKLITELCHHSYFVTHILFKDSNFFATVWHTKFSDFHFIRIL